MDLKQTFNWDVELGEFFPVNKYDDAISHSVATVGL